MANTDIDYYSDAYKATSALLEKRAFTDAIVNGATTAANWIADGAQGAADWISGVAPTVSGAVNTGVQAVGNGLGTAAQWAAANPLTTAGIAAGGAAGLAGLGMLRRASNKRKAYAAAMHEMGGKPGMGFGAKLGIGAGLVGAGLLGYNMLKNKNEQ